MTSIHYHSDPLLPRKAAAKYLREVRGIPIAPQTLAKYAMTGDGPQYRKFGRRPLYTIADLDSWADAKLGSPRRSTSEVGDVYHD